jgi:hypothetical protein
MGSSSSSPQLEMIIEKKTAKNKPTQSDWKNPTDLRV